MAGAGGLGLVNGGQESDRLKPHVRSGFTRPRAHLSWNRRVEREDRPLSSGRGSSGTCQRQIGEQGNSKVQPRGETQFHHRYSTPTRTSTASAFGTINEKNASRSHP